MNSFKERFRTLLKILPIILWSDQYFIYVIAILSEKNKLYYPMLAFLHRFKKFASIITIPLFEKQIDDDILEDANQFLSKNFIRNMKVNYYQFIKATELFMMRSSNSFHYVIYTQHHFFSDELFYLKKKIDFT